MVGAERIPPVAALDPADEPAQEEDHEEDDSHEQQVQNYMILMNSRFKTR